MAYLDIETPEGKQRVLLERDSLSIGRLSYNDLVLPSAQISRQHAELRCINGEWWIADLQSTNGLHINGKRVQQHQLANGDRILLAPEISLRFLDGMPQPQAQPPMQPQPPEQPVAAPPLNTPRPPLGPRSPFADDEEPYFPPGMPYIPAPSPRIPTPLPETARPSAPYIPTQPPQPSTMAGSPSMPGFGSSGGGYPTAPAPGFDAVLRDPFRRSSPGTSGSNQTGGPASKLLHVCQTCSQLTAPDAVYCQNCHHSIAYECPKCRLALLPIHDRCPRCQTPNPASVRRARRAPGV